MRKKNTAPLYARAFAAAYIHYTTYLNPVTHKPGSLNDVIDWLVLQKQREAELPKRVIAVGLRKWKAANLAPLLSLHAYSNLG
ncbi:hypothetical protein HAALTHF_29610n [Vreelandella aquamarina]|nr:hypothetical protein HAALTHF_29610n [Halomonas axialensis]